MSERILLVDDDELVLSAYERGLRGHIAFETACGGAQALEKLKTGEPVAVILSDLRMPGMNGLEMLRQAHEISPDSVRLILTGNADLRTAIDAVNEGNIFRFLEKPCPADALVKVLTSALNQYRLLTTEKDILEKTLHGSIKVLAEVIELINPDAFSMSSRITPFVKHIATSLGLKEGWRYEMAAMLSNLGCVVLSQHRGGVHVAQNLLRNIPRLEVVAGIIGRQQEPFHSQSHDPIEKRDPETLGAQMLRVCIRFDELVRKGDTYAAAVDSLLKEPGEYDPELAALLRTVPVAALPYESKIVEVKNLQLRMVLDQEVRTTTGILLVKKGVEITDPLLARLANFNMRGAISDSVRVLVPA